MTRRRSLREVLLCGSLLLSGCSGGASAGDADAIDPAQEPEPVQGEPDVAAAGGGGMNDGANSGVTVLDAGAAGTACDPSSYLSVGFNHACAVTELGEVVCWGAAQGNGTDADLFSAALVPGVSGAIAVAAGSNHSCALLGTGELSCWGDNAFGAFGLDFDAVEPSPVLLPGAARFKAV